MSTNRKTITPMDDGIRERSVGEAAVNRQRECWAIKTLVGEVLALFPETSAEYSNYNGRNTALDVTFDLTGMEGGDSVVFNNLLCLLDDGADPRVREVITEDYAQALVSMHPDPRTHDLRNPFGIAQAYEALTADDDGPDDLAWVDEVVHYDIDGPVWVDELDGGS